LFASSSDPLAQKYLAVFRQRLRELGYVEGKTIVIDERFAAGSAQATDIHAGNPIGAGLIASLARPCGNVTGTANLPLGGEHVDLMRKYFRA
jgi:hypothetical protein